MWIDSHPSRVYEDQTLTLLRSMPDAVPVRLSANRDVIKIMSEAIEITSIGPITRLIDRSNLFTRR
jgi:hypothetical protein